MIIAAASQMVRARLQSLRGEISRRTPDRVPIREEHLWVSVRLVLGLLQMLGAALSVILLVLTGMTAVALTAVTVTCALTSISVLLFGAKRSK